MAFPQMVGQIGEGRTNNVNAVSLSCVVLCADSNAKSDHEKIAGKHGAVGEEAYLLQGKGREDAST